MAILATILAAHLAATPIDAATVQQVIAAAAEHLRREYVIPDLGSAMATELERRWKAGEYARFANGADLAGELTRQLQELSHDQHLRVTFGAIPEDVKRDSESAAHRHTRITGLGARINYGFRKAEVLPGNIGLLAIDGFWHLEFGGGDTAAAAMAFVSHTDALIIDLRESSNGGDPAMAILLATYFFPTRVHLGDFYSRPANDTTQWWTESYVPGDRYIDKPLFILTSRKTFSAAEGFAYDLQSQKRAIVIGERTAGAAHPEEEHALTGDFAIELPFARTINSVTRTDWEGIGVVPDIEVDPTSALDRAEREAMTRHKP